MKKKLPQLKYLWVYLYLEESPSLVFKIKRAGRYDTEHEKHSVASYHRGERKWLKNTNSCKTVDAEIKRRGSHKED